MSKIKNYDWKNEQESRYGIVGYALCTGNSHVRGNNPCRTDE